MNYNPTLNVITMSDDYFITYRALRPPHWLNDSSGESCHELPHPNRAIQVDVQRKAADKTFNDSGKQTSDIDTHINRKIAIGLEDDGMARTD
ncbi:hypothetical protein [Variovorax boronicumulans]|uniref:hypothetical protein n=2 Tax=Variovorax boronicumulans TaxID=436515 RepID=UPI0027D84251|nr:hypothetical protein [Variovorax boronicumulans]